MNNNKTKELKKEKLYSTLIGLLEYIFAGLAIYFILRLIIQNWGKIEDQFSTINYAALFVSFLLAMLTLFVQGLAWFYLHKKIGKNVRFLDLLDAYYSSNLIRYVPGNIWSYLARIRLHRKLGISRSEVLYLSLIEIIFFIVPSWLVFLVSLFFWTKPLIISNKYTIFIVVSILFLFFAVFSPAVIKWYIRKYMDDKKITYAFIKLPFINLVKIFFIYLFFWIVYGLSLLGAVLAFTKISPSIVIPVIGINAIAWTVGFVSFITPSGIGAREPTMIFFLASYVPTAVAGIISVLARLITVVSDVLMTGIVRILRIIRTKTKNYAVDKPRKII